MTLRLEIVTPEAKTFSDDVDQVVLPGVEGEFGVLPGHEALVTQINPGELVVSQKGQTHLLAVGEGFVEVLPDKVSVITDMAIRADDINEAEAEAARKRAEEALTQKLSDDENAAVQAALQKSLAQLHVKRRRRGGA
jgi:F-type H+-transporting ATPase subunit epsilon